MKIKPEDQGAVGGAKRAAAALRIVIVEDSATDAELVMRELKRGGDQIHFERVDSSGALLAALERGPCDAVISDFGLPGFSGLDALQIVKSRDADMPFILVSGTVGEEVAVQMLKAGADDYVLKGNLARLPSALKAQLREAEERRARRRSEQGLRRAQAMAKLAHVVTGPDGSFDSWSETLPQLTGLEPAQMPASTRDWLELLHPDDRARFREKSLEAAAKGTRVDVEYRLRRPEGAWSHLRQVMEPLQESAAADRSVRWFSTLQDVTEEKRAEEKIQRLNRVHAVLSGINSAIVRIRDRQQLLEEACRIAVEAGQLRLAWIGIVDLKREEIIPAASSGVDQGWLGIIRLSIRAQSDRLGMAGRAIRERSPVVSNDLLADERALFRKESAERGYRSLAMIPLIVHGEAFGVLGLHAAEPGFFDQEELRLLMELAGDIAFGIDHIEQEEKVEHLTRVYAVLSGINAAIVRIRDRQELFREACRVAVEGGRFPLAWIATVDRDSNQLRAVAWAGDERGFVHLVRPTVEAIGAGKAGLSAQAIDRRGPVICNDIEADASAMRYAKEALERGYRSAVALPLEVDGAPIGALVLYAAERGFFDDEEMKLLIELAGDISFALGHLQKAEKLNYLAYYDELTGLANSTLFHERLDQYVSAARGANRRLAVFVLDVDRFKTVNDAFGRQAGDEVLKQIAERLVSRGGDPNRLARLGADHFAGVVPDVHSEDRLARVTELRFQECFGPPYRVAGQELRVSARVGIAIFPNDGTDAASLFRNAEAALKKAKATGERYLFYTKEMSERVADKLSLENKLRQALENEDFVLHYQPKVDVETRKIVGVEALIRWHSPELGLVPPGQFIPLLEETGLILQVGSWALARAARDHRAWVGRKLKAPRVAVNVSQIQLRQRDFVAVVEQAIIDGVAPTGIDLEITESLVMEDVKANIEKLKAVRGLGVRIAIDDFGTGYSSLGYLAQLPVESLKIDRSFIIKMQDDPNAMTLVSTIISLAHSLRLKVVAEGVETEDQAKFLRLLRCDEMQGYLFSKALPEDELLKLLRP
jgi:diguanylate cyclase (GGDEF)-like protein/PAS domain S-box-containing protein